MNSLYKDYIESKVPNRKVVEFEDVGFIEYEVMPNDVIYVWHLYVRPEHRGKSSVRDLERIIIETEKPKTMMCDVQLDWKDCESSLGIILHGGYKIFELDEKEKRLTLVRYLE